MWPKSSLTLRVSVIHDSGAIMKAISCSVFIFAVLCASEALAAGPEQAGPVQAPCPHCQGQIVYHDVVSHRCKLVPDKKQIKKTVYEVKEVPFCLHKLPPLFSHHHGDCCDDCPECDCPRYKRVLIKREIVCEEVCGTKCVVEEFVERVPCRVCCPDCPSCGPASQVPGSSVPPVVVGPPIAARQPLAPPLDDQVLVHIPLPVVTR
jgi:hypothetical protein